MRSKDRIIKALKHEEPDKVPLDMCGLVNSGIHINAYRNLLAYLHIKKSNIQVCDVMQQLACVDEDILEILKVDTRGIYPNEPSNWKLDLKEESNDSKYFIDQYGIKWKMPKNGYYFDPTNHPLSGLSLKNLSEYRFPDPRDKERLKKLKEKIIDYHNRNFFVHFYFFCGGFFEVGMWMRGFENFYCDLILDPKFACLLMDKLLEIEIEFWDLVLSEMGDYIDMIFTANDIGGQNGLLISPTIYRKYIKPRQKKLNSFIRSKKPNIFIYYHSCGAIYDIIPDLIEIGVDALNPVQVSSAKMDTKKLKKEFGKDITFWGGGVDTQRVLPFGTPEVVKEEVKRRIEDLAPGGGFVFATVHNIQADVPPQNIMAMWEALQEFGKY